MQDGREHALQRLRLGDIAGMDGVHERQSFESMDHAEHELAGNTASLLVHPEGTQVVVHLALAVDAYSGEIVEHHGQVPVDLRPDLAGECRLHGLCVIHQRVHRPQQMLVLDRRRHRGHGHRFQPAQTAELAVGRAEQVEDHRPDQRLNIDLPATGTQGRGQRAVEAEVLPELMQRKDIAISQGRIVDHLRGGVLGPAGCTVQAADEGVELARLQGIEAPQIGHDAQPRLARVVAEGLDDLQVAAAAGLGDARKYGMQNTPLCIFRKYTLSISHVTKDSRRNGRGTALTPRFNYAANGQPTINRHTAVELGRHV